MTEAEWSDPIAVISPPDWLRADRMVIYCREGLWFPAVRADALDWGDWFTGKGPQITHIRTKRGEGQNGR